MNAPTIKTLLFRTLICLTCLLSGVASAQAQGAPTPSHQDLSPAEQQELVRLIDAGQEAFDAGEFATALAAFEEAYAFFPHPDLQYRIARCHEYLGELPEAIQAYQSFLERAPQAEERGRVEKTIKVLRERHAQKQPATLTITIVPMDANVFVDSKRIPNPSSNQGRLELSLGSGAHEVRVTKRGFREKRQVVKVAAGESRSVGITLEFMSNGPDMSAQDFEPVHQFDAHPGSGSSDGWRGTGPVIVASIGLLAGGLSTYGYILYAGADEKIEDWDAQKDTIIRPSEYDTTHDDRTVYEAVTWTTGVISVASLATAAIWWWGFSDEAPAAATASADAGVVALDAVTLSPGTNTDDAAGTWSVFVSGRF